MDDPQELKRMIRERDAEIERLRAEVAQFHCQECGGFQIPEGTDLYCGCQSGE